MRGHIRQSVHFLGSGSIWGFCRFILSPFCLTKGLPAGAPLRLCQGPSSKDAYGSARINNPFSNGKIRTVQSVVFLSYLSAAENHGYQMHENFHKSMKRFSLIQGVTTVTLIQTLTMGHLYGFEPVRILDFPNSEALGLKTVVTRS